MKTRILYVILGLQLMGILLMANDNPVQNKLMAKRAAIADAQRNLIEKIYGINIDANTSVEDFIIKNDQVRGKLEGFITSAEIISESYKDGLYEVKLQIDMERLIKLLGKKFKYEIRFIEEDGKGTSKGDPEKKKKEHKQELLKEKGNGVMPTGEDISKEQKILMAKRAAMLDAYRNIIEKIKGVQVDGQTTVQDFITEDDSIMTKIENFVHGAEVINSKIVEEGDLKGSYEVEIEIDLKELKKIFK